MCSGRAWNFELVLFTCQSLMSLKMSARSISPAITALLNLSFKQAKVPDAWKTSKVTPIFKSGDPSLASNYCPMSLLPVLAKIQFTIRSCTSFLKITISILTSLVSARGPQTQEALLSVTNDWHFTLPAIAKLQPSFSKSKRHLIPYLMTSASSPFPRWASEAPCYTGLLTILQTENKELFWITSPHSRCIGLVALNFHREEKIDHYVTETKTIIKYSPPVTTKTKTIVDNLLLN